MNLTEAVERACQEPSLIDALSWICVWESERAIQQALEWQKTGVSTAAYGSWDTCFKPCIEEVMKNYPKFKLGDKVKVIRNVDNYGWTGVVTEIIDREIKVDFSTKTI
jgi:hypothetical protein